MAVHKTHHARRESILAAAQHVAREGGLRAVNVRAIASQVGTSPASVLYYFNSMDELMEVAIEHIMEQFYTDRRLLIEGIDDPVQQLRLLIEAGVPDDVPDDMRLVYEITSTLPQHPQFGPTIRAIHEEQLAMYEDVIQRGVGRGVFAPNPSTGVVARNLLAIEDTYDFYPVMGLDVDRAELRANLKAYASVSLGVEI